MHMYPNWMRLDFITSCSSLMCKVQRRVTRFTGKLFHALLEKGLSLLPLKRGLVYSGGALQLVWSLCVFPATFASCFAPLLELHTP